MYASETNDRLTTGSDRTANFMFNQLVWWNNDLGNDYITKWTYTPKKYWPNEVTNSTTEGVDDQDNDKNDNPAYTTYTHGGNVSFFAYAPYVDFSDDATKGINYTTGASPDPVVQVGKTSGIVAINGKTINSDATASNNANAQDGDPILTYIVAESGKDVVDLLWGTYDGTRTNVNQDGNTGVSGANTTSAPLAPHTTYAAEILNGYKTNADLTKQKTNGTIGFAFKHALAKVGGSTTYDPSDPTKPVKNGLLVMLDIDDMKGAEVGGEKDATTKVTVKEVKIVARTLVDDGTRTPGEDTYTPTYLKKAQGDLNLATGTWSVLRTENTQTTPTTGTTSIIDQDGTGDNVTGELNEEIKEPDSWDNTWASNPVGVETVAKNVYKDGTEAFPMVFIPGTYPELTISIDYLVRTEDTNLKNGYSEVEQVITKKLTFSEAVKLNKQYSIIMHLGLTSVKFEAKVSDWEQNTSTTNNFDSDGDGTVDIKVENVWLPINVAGLMTTYSATELESNANTLTLSTATLYNYENNTQTDVKSSVILTVGNNNPTWQGNSWLTAAATPDNTVILTANETFTTRTADITATYTVGSNYITDVTKITQKGRIAEKAKVTFTGITDITTAVQAGESKTYTAITVTADGKESDGTTDISNFVAVNENEIGDIVFKDDNGVVSWITYDKATKTITIAPNTTGASRSAKMYIYVGGKLVPVRNATDNAQITLTQAAS